MSGNVGSLSLIYLFFNLYCVFLMKLQNTVDDKMKKGLDIIIDSVFDSEIKSRDLFLDEFIHVRPLLL